MEFSNLENPNPNEESQPESSKSVTGKSSQSIFYFVPTSICLICAFLLAETQEKWWLKPENRNKIIILAVGIVVCLGGLAAVIIGRQIDHLFTH